MREAQGRDFQSCLVKLVAEDLLGEGDWERKRFCGDSTSALSVVTFV